MRRFWKSLRMYLWMTVLTGLLYPLLITGIAQLTLSSQALGSIETKQGKPMGSQLIGQKFEADRYFWGRPSASNYNALASGGSNFGPTSKALKEAIDKRKAEMAQHHNVEASHVPLELLFASGSGLDPHISPFCALFQMERVIKARGLPAEEGHKQVKQLIELHTIRRAFGFLGEPCVNVLLLNKSLDELEARR